MRTLLITFILLIQSCGVTVQMRHEHISKYDLLVAVTKPPRDGFVIRDSRLRKFVRMFKADARKAGYNPDTLFKNIKRFEVRNLKPGRYGFYDSEKQIIVINSKWVDNYSVAKKTMYHEIGHSIGLDHCHQTCWHIMSEYFPPEEFNNNQWNLMINQFFRNEN